MNPEIIIHRLRQYWLEILLFLAVITAGFVGLEHIPPVWWDEGWTLTVARNWVEQGHYGLYQDGLPRDAGLAGHFPMVALVSLSFRMFGVGVWQGRLPDVLFSFILLSLLYYFSNRWFGRKVALGTILASILLSLPQVSVLIAGRQVMGEVPSLCLLVAGYVFLDIAFERNRLLLIATALLWGIGIALKSQPLPFWLVSVFFYLLGCAFTRRLSRCGWVLVTAVVSYFVYRLSGAIPSMLAQSVQGAVQPVEGLMNVTAMVLDKNVRLTAVLMVVVYGLPTLVGLAWSGWKISKEFTNREESIHPAKWALWGFASSWFAWYLLLGMSWTRYLFPAVLSASPFIAACLSDLTHGYDLRWLVNQFGRSSREEEKRPGLQAILGWTFILIFFALGIIAYPAYLHNAQTIDPQAAALKLQAIIPANSLIETYESEIMFLAPSLRFHFPPDQISVNAIEHGELNPGISLGYDPLKANPAYLLIGEYGKQWGIYDAVLKQGVFRLIDSFSGYDLYARVY